ncbi:UNVERIFIED_CONTAM: hypothetical protein Sradi_4014200 [Sesamum radiatum]|uniref:Helitron helicase-like domain-containing protein n=1 Tax=Sesamum radiatum TaxID=300843 RepID=A0AAW2PKU5_SESRA
MEDNITCLLLLRLLRIVGDGQQSRGTRDIVIEERGRGLQRITELHPSFMAMQYPLLFPYGEDGFRTDITRNPRSQNTLQQKSKRQFINLREYHAYRLQNRINEAHTLVSGGRLYHQYIVDAFTCIEESNLRWVRNNKKKLRSELYKGLRDVVVRGDTTPGSVGKRFVLPSSFTGGPRYMVQNYQDAMAICRYYGPPDIFLTFTCNPKWSEIQMFVDLIPGQKVEDRPDVVARVFKIKLDELMKDLRQRQHFGRVLAVYRRRDNKRTATKNGIEVDNRWVVPHNIDLIVKYQAHINIEWCNQGRSIKYLFKYVNKGKDRATFVIEENVSIDGVAKSTIVNEVDEIKRYLDARYVSVSEASWRIFEFDIQYRSPGVERLSFHLSDEQNVIFGDDDQLDDVLNKEGIEKTMFTEWMQMNNVDPSARELTYADFPTKFVWHAKEKKWKKRKSGRCIGRIYYAHHHPEKIFIFECF